MNELANKALRGTWQKAAAPLSFALNSMNNKIKFEPSRLAQYDTKNILDEIRRVINEKYNGTIPPINMFEQHSRVKGWAIRKHFGSWANALNKASFDYKGTNYAEINLSRDKFDKNKMLKDLERVKDLNNGKYFTYDFYKINEGAYSIKTLKKYFRYSHWQELLLDVLSLERKPKRKLRILKIKKESRSDYTKDQLFAELKRTWDILGRRPSYLEFRKFGQIGTKVYERHFGSWTCAIQKFCEKFKYPIHGTPFTNATPDILLSELKSIASSLQTDILTYKTYKAHRGTYSIGTFQKHFGSWQKAIEKIGFRDGHSGKYSTEQLFTEIQNLWERLGKQPSYKEMNKFGTISGTAYQKRFGSWSKAIHAFCSDRNSDDDYLEKTQSEDILSREHIAINHVHENIAPIEKQNFIVVTTPRTPSLKQRFKVFKRDSFKCVCCGRSPATHTGLILEVDHKIPYSKGGETILENLQTLCSDCNRGKSDSIGHEQSSQ